MAPCHVGLQLGLSLKGRDGRKALWVEEPIWAKHRGVHMRLSSHREWQEDAGAVYGKGD